MFVLLLLACEPAPVAAPPPMPEPALLAASPAPVTPIEAAVAVTPPEPIVAPAPPPRRPLPDAALPKASALPEATADNYPAIVAAIEEARRAFATQGSYEQARAYLLDAITQRIIPAWKGTRWTFYGADPLPSEGGQVACGYWVASVLRDAGLRIDRNRVGQQASELILLTVAEPKRLRHFGDRYDEVPPYAAKVGVGLWGVGLANHAGLLWNDGTEVKFCHSDYHGSQGPRCEPADASWAFRTSYTVIAPILGDATLDAWFAGDTLVTGKFGERHGG